MPRERWDEPPCVIFDDRRQFHLTETQCDACPPSAPLNSTYSPPTLGTYSFSSTLATSRLDGHHWVAYAPDLPAGPAVLNNPAMALLRHFEHPHPLKELTSPRNQDALLALLHTHLLVPSACPTPHPSTSPETLIAWFHTTRACNLRCAYCYLDAGPEAMSFTIGERAVDAVFRSAAKNHMSGVKLKYAGGEPTLAFPLIAHVHHYAIELAKEHALNLDGIIISNGVTTSHEMLKAMQSLGLRLAISLDGLGEHHDCQRRLSDGSGSFAAVSSTIDRALSIGITPDISITVTDRNLSGLPELTRWLLERDLPFRFEFLRGNDASTLQDNLRLDKQRTIETMRAVYRIIVDNLPHRSLLASLLDRTNLAWPHARTCGAGINYLAVDTQGRIAKCQMDIDYAITDIYADDPLTDLKTDRTSFQNLSTDEKSDCQECQWRYWCGGGCPLESYRTTGQGDTKSPYCSIYKALFPDVLRLEGLRLLEFHNHASQ